jgi:hypothetical protein
MLPYSHCGAMICFSFVKSSGEILSTLRTVFLTRSQWIGLSLAHRSANCNGGRDDSKSTASSVRCHNLIKREYNGWRCRAIFAAQNSRRHHVDLRSMVPPWAANEAGISKKYGLQVEVIATPSGIQGTNALIANGALQGNRIQAGVFGYPATGPRRQVR